MRSRSRPRSFGKSRVQHHLAMATASLLLAGIVYRLTPPPDVRHRLSMATAYAALAFMVATLSLGPWNVIRRRSNPVSSDLRRDLGVWAGALALLHTGVGLTVHLRGRMWMYFVRRLHPLRLQTNLFGFANDAGLLAAILFVVLLAISNDRSLRLLGVPRWKSVQRWTYAAAALTVVHGALFQIVERRSTGFVLIFYAGVAIVVSAQLAGLRHRRRQPDAPAKTKAIRGLRV